MRNILRKIFNVLVIIFVIFSIYSALSSGSILNKAENNVINSANMVKDILNDPSLPILATNIPTNQISDLPGSVPSNISPTFVKIRQNDGTIGSCKNPDANLKNLVIKGQSELKKMIALITTLKDQVNEGIGNGVDMNGVVVVYNQDVANYQKKYFEIENMRLEYNKQALSFNSCIGSAGTQ